MQINKTKTKVSKRALQIRTIYFNINLTFFFSKLTYNIKTKPSKSQFKDKLEVPTDILLKARLFIPVIAI